MHKAYDTTVNVSRIVIVKTPVFENTYFTFYFRFQKSDIYVFSSTERNRVTPLPPLCFAMAARDRLKRKFITSRFYKNCIKMCYRIG